jgi:hypothetical protein
MSSEAKLMSGIILLTIPSIQYGGYFLLRVLSGKFRSIQFNGFQQTMFRAGHAHAGVLVILSLVCQIIADYATLPISLTWFARAGVPASALLISGGFFFSALGKDTQTPNQWIALLYVGIFLLASSLVALGIGLLN